MCVVGHAAFTTGDEDCVVGNGHDDFTTGEGYCLIGIEHADFTTGEGDCAVGVEHANFITGDGNRGIELAGFTTCNGDCGFGIGLDDRFCSSGDGESDIGNGPVDGVRQRVSWGTKCECGRTQLVDWL